MTDLFFVMILIFAAVFDFKNHKIPDVFCLGLVLITMAAWLIDAGDGRITELSYFVESFKGIWILAGGMVFIDLFRPDAFGGGDIKLSAAAGMYLGWRRMIAAGMMTITAAGIGCLILLIMRKINGRTKIAFGPFLAIGLMMGLFWGDAIFVWLRS